MKTRAKSEYKKCFPYLLHLLSCAINGKTPSNPSADSEWTDKDWEVLLRLSEFHSVANTVAFAVSALSDVVNIPQHIVAAFSRHKAMSVVADTNISVETETLLQLLGDAGVDVLPVKGYVLRQDYPLSAMRSMTDVDIIYNSKKKKKVRDIFLARGYELTESGYELDFKKDGINHYELHGASDKSPATSHTFLPDILSRAVYDNKSHIGRLTIEDSYLYILSHLAKHILGGGAGIRMVMDVYVFYNAHGKSMNRAYLAEQLRTLRLAEFEKKIRFLAYSWFQTSTPDTNSVLADFILCACTFGITRDAFLESALKKEKETGKKQTSSKTIFSKIFPSFKFISEVYPVVAKCRILYPFCIPVYWFTRIFKKRNINTENFRHYFIDTDSEDAERLRAAINQAGLSNFL